MTTTTEQHVRTRSDRVGRAGSACWVAGLVGAATGFYLAVRPPVVGADMWTYPSSIGEYALTQVVFALVHVGMILGLLALRWCGAVPDTRAGRTGHVVAVAGMAGLTINELLAIGPAGETTDSSAVGPVVAIYGLVTTMIGLGMIVAGVAAVRYGTWSGWRRWLPLVIGVYLFFPTMPALVLEGDAARIVLGIWALLFAVLGWSLRGNDAATAARRFRPTQQATRVP